MRRRGSGAKSQRKAHGVRLGARSIGPPLVLSSSQFAAGNSVRVWRRGVASLASSAEGTPAGPKHEDKTNTVRFISRAISADPTAEVAYNDVKSVLELLLSIENALAEPIGLQPAPGEH